VVISCYNLGRYLDEAVSSALAQTWRDLEVVVVDDGSTDPETQRLLADYRRPRTRVLRTENRGLPAARNVGIRSSTGVYLCALDADRRLEPTWIEKAVGVLDADPSLGFVSHRFRSFGDEEWDWTPERCDLLSLLDSNTVDGAALVRRDVLERVGLFDEAMRQGCEDWELWLRVVGQGFRGAILPEVLYEYRRRPGSMSRELMAGDGYAAQFRYLVEKHRRLYQEHFLELWLRRESRIGESLRHAYDVERDCREWLERARRQEELALLRRKLAEVDREREREQERARLATRVAELDAAEQERERLARHARALEAEIASRQQRITDLERSWSWRLTAPVRAVLDRIARRSPR
jgi:glycosyltransferase involved in cell wall biosynthesis